ncbi:hypothetical protein WN990_18700 [Kitasatospora purpeofusca]|uniref:hypothetical protein n=1 Tax=Kitasatospora purpeofusca TaxID=67352 RepID=UPI0030F1AD42
MAHPLTLLRAVLGLSQPEYARLVARAHDELGLGRMAARREKVSRWESGRIVPEHSAQLAIAHLHGVPAREVARLGWPFWMHLATGDGVPLDDARDDPRLYLPRGGPRLPASERPPGFALRGDRLAAQMHGLLARLADPRRAPGHEEAAQTAQAVERVDWIEARTEALEQQMLVSLLPSRLLLAAAHTEHRQVAHLLAAAGPGGAAARRLLRLSARTALLCSGFSCALGELAEAERHALTAVRAGATAGDRGIAATAMAQLARHHLLASNAADALGLLRAARTAAPELSVSTALELHNGEASAFAQLGRATEAARALDLAAEAFAAADRAATGTATESAAYRRFAAIGRAAVWSFLGRPARARPQLAALADSLTASGGSVPSPYSALWFLYIVNGHLELGELDVAADAVHRIRALTGELPPVLASDLRHLLAPHRHERLLREALDDLGTPMAP